MFNIREELTKLPKKPGVYIFKDKNKNIIYIGKAVVLRNRVRQYFQSLKNQPAKVKVMVSNISEFEYIITDSELEALILECNLIKKNKPKFNILLKDDKHYPYIKITINEEYPRILMVRKIEKDGAKYFGPYFSSLAVKNTIDFIKRIFPIKVCKKKLPRDLKKGRECLNYHIHRCLGPCQGYIESSEYKKIIEEVCDFLEGKQDDIIKKLEIQMDKAARGLNFELAASIRDKISGLNHIKEKQKVISSDFKDKDIIAFAKDEEDSCVQIFFVRKGILIGREKFIFEDIGEVEERELLTSFVKQFYNKTEYIPEEIIMQTNIEEAEIIEKWLKSKRKSRVYLTVPKRGEKVKLLNMVVQNALVELNSFKANEKIDNTKIYNALMKLSSILDLQKNPQRIEAYDISNTGHSEIVGSMVVFINGKPSKKDYRRFNIAFQNNQDDYSSMRQVMFRRLKYLKDDNQDKKGTFNKIPDLILIDGGIGHVNAVGEVLKDMSLNLNIAGMVKNDRHRTRGLVTMGKEISLEDKADVLKLITVIQDEAHRFAIEYNKTLRKKRYTYSVLDSIEGIGPKRKKLLIKHFGSAHGVRQATLEQLLEVEGVTETIAKRIYNYFNS